jgi:hypothetical protein
MKKATFSSRGPSSRFRFLLAVCLGIALAGLPSRADAEAVDSELLLLVDVTQGGINTSQFNRLMDGYAAAMTSSQVLDSIESGELGKIAVSLVFYGNAFTQTVGIPWMMIGSAAEAQQFADLVTVLSRPFSSGSPSTSAAMDYAANHFGTETGGASNGFESQVQIVEVAATALPLFPNPSGDQDARDDALASGVDIINTVALGNRASSVANYHASNVVGGEVGGIAGSSSTAALNGTLDSFLANHMQDAVQGGAVASVPEPSSALCLISGIGFLLLGRRRREGYSHSSRV